MTNRLAYARVLSSRQYAAAGQVDIDSLAIGVLDDTPITLALPATLVGSKYIPSARNLAGTTESQTSNNTRYAQGFVKEGGVPVSRTVAVYRRDTKELIRTCVSEANGFFHTSWKGYDGLVYVIAFDNEDDSPYNAKVFDFVTS